MCSMQWGDRNFARVSEKNGGLLLVNNLFDGQFGKIRFCSFCIMGPVVFEDIWYMKGYLLKVSVTRRYYLLLYMKKPAVRSCQGESSPSLGSIGCTACLTLGLVQSLHQMM